MPNNPFPTRATADVIGTRAGRPMRTSAPEPGPIGNIYRKMVGIVQVFPVFSVRCFVSTVPYRRGVNTTTHLYRFQYFFLSGRARFYASRLIVMVVTVHDVCVCTRQEI